MRVCQPFSLALVALTMLGAGCAAPGASRPTGLSGANAPLTQAMQQAQEQSAPAAFHKRTP